MICESAFSTIVQERWLFLQKQLFGAVLLDSFCRNAQRVFGKYLWRSSYFKNLDITSVKKRTLTLVFFNSLAFF